MKRFFLLSLVAAFVSLMSVSAQDNTYSMIIKLANGTTLTIGPNEVDSISFNDGEITVSGSTISDLVAGFTAAQVETQMRIDSLSNVLMMHYATIEDIMQALANIPIPDLSNYPTKAELTDLLYKYATKEDLQYEQDMRAKEDQNLMELVQKVDADHKKTEDTLKLEIDELKSMANALNAAVNAMNTRIDYLENEINKLKGN
ncbi:MAG: hypothetical protein IJQ49_06740 [Prevotella sp.]|nr:hypothetical protein [Prevotella sp.]